MSSAAVPDRVARSLRPRPRWSVSQWAIRRPFVIAEKGATRPGPYDLSFTPWWREVLDACADPDVHRVNVVASAQTGKTKAGEIVLAYQLEHHAANAIYIRPTEDDVGEAYRDRFAPMLRANLSELCPAGEFVTTSKNPVITLRDSNVYGAAATIPRQLTSRTAPFVWYDETDSAGDVAAGLGNTLDLALERQMAESASRILLLGTSTPRSEHHSNYSAFATLSDGREYHEPCPKCGTYQRLALQSIRAPDPPVSVDQMVDQGLAVYRCADCAELIPQDYQHWMSDRGRWCPAVRTITERLPLEDEDIVERGSLAILPDEERWEPATEGATPPKHHRGYRIWRANTKFELATWSHILARWKAIAPTRDPRRLRVFFNNWLAEPFRESIAPADEEHLRTRIGDYDPGTVPTRARVILAAVDIQDAAIWYVARAFGANQESWLIQYARLEVAANQHLEALDYLYDLVFVQGWPVAGSDDGLRMRAYALACDSGYNTDSAYRFADRPGVIATKGQDSTDYRVRVTQAEKRATKEPVNLYHLNVRAMGDRLQRYIKTPDGEPGAWHLHRDTSDEYIAHLASEELRGRRSNPRVKTWQLKIEGRPNHTLDCERYILGLAEALEQRRELSIMTLQETDPALGQFRRPDADNPPPGPAGTPKPGPKPPRKPRRGLHIADR